METKSTGKFLLSAPRKIRLVADEIRGYSYPEAMDILRFIPRKGSRYIESVLKTARSNAVSLQKDLREEDLY
ncbi:MAG TPA: uL22 family ribosomal protein, partial [Leptospiraceae bacterium]|nr:uL22 family ribosomal protein [Leptospiraceae bacterium]